MNALVSIVVPIYNVKKYLEKCIDSLRRQSYKNIEILLIDDGSTDGSSKIVDKYARLDSRVIAIHKPNGGLSDARNVGIDNHKGKYIFFIDSDDYIHQDTIQILMDVAIKTNADIVECGVKYVDDDSQLKWETNSVAFDLKPYNHDEAVKRILSYEFKIMAWNKLYKSELFSDIRFPVGKIHEDEFTTPYLVDKCKIYVTINNELYAYVQRNNSIMNNKFNYSRLDCIEAHEKRINYFNKKYNYIYDNEMNYRYFISLVNLKVLMGNEYKNSIVCEKLKEEFVLLVKTDSKIGIKIKGLMYYFFSKQMINRLIKR